jgi:prepilin-type N-terminal cleavage/methylation domain-containing protein
METQLRKRTRDRERGFSLMEIMMTTLLMGTMFSVVLPPGKAAIQKLAETRS